MATNPTLLTQPIAANGAKNVIPNTTSTAGAMSQDQGFPAETALPLGAGGVAPSREDFNGAFNLLSGILYMAQKGWVFLFDENQDYFAGCMVRDPLDSKIYEAINNVPASSTHPSADTTNWKEFGTDTSNLANVDLSNLSLTGQNAFATKTLSNLDTANLACHVVVDSYYDSTTGDWWRVYDDGWVEQGGRISTPADLTAYTLTLIKAMADTLYTAQLSITIPSSNNGCMVNEIQGNRTTTGLVFRCYFYNSSLSANDFATWTVCGMGANS